MKNEPGLSPKAQKSREHILNTALEMFQKNGFEETSMRQIAQAAGVATGGAYYYFKTKDEMVMEFYRNTLGEAESHNRRVLGRTKDFRERIRDIIVFKMDQMEPYRPLAQVLVKSATDLRNPLSPFSPDTRDVREGALQMIRDAIEDCNLKIPPKLAPQLPKLIWLFQMGILFSWIHDHSEGSKKTLRLLDLGLDLIMLAIKSASIPFMGKVTDSMVEIFSILEESPKKN